MAGPGLRYYYLARTLAREFEVILAAPDGSASPGDVPLLAFRSGADPAVGAAVRSADVVIVPVTLMPQLPVLFAEPAVPVVVDGYDPLLAETLMLGGDEAAVLQAQTLAAVRGDFFMCAGPRQRDWWLGWLEAMGRVNRYTWAEDPTLGRLVSVVPSGVPEGWPAVTGPVARRIWPELPADAELVIWGGGLWPWLDPVTAVRAVAKVRSVRPQVCLIFPGFRHPNPGMAGIPTGLEAARELARELDLLGRAVFFNEWVAYADWPGLLAEGRVGLSLHRASVEARLAFRSRVLDYIWAGLPVVATGGDETARWVRRYRLGILVGVGDDDAVARGLLELLGRPREAFARRFQKARRALAWSRVIRPLAEFCRRPRCAPDRIALGDRLGSPVLPAGMLRTSICRDQEPNLVAGWWRRLARWAGFKGR